MGLKILKRDAIGLISPRTLDFAYKEAVQLLFLRLVVLLPCQLVQELMYKGRNLSLPL
jgi:hypothetical protein